LGAAKAAPKYPAARITTNLLVVIFEMTAQAPGLRNDYMN